MASVNAPVPPRQVTLPSGDSLVPTVDDLLHLDPDEFVGRYTDIAAVNLACARGLLPIEEREFPEYMVLLDTIAEAVERETEQSRRLFKLKPAQFHHSEAVFRMYTMEHVFRRRFGIRYDDKVKETIEQGRRSPYLCALPRAQEHWRTVEASRYRWPGCHRCLASNDRSTCQLVE